MHKNSDSLQFDDLVDEEISDHESRKEESNPDTEHCGGYREVSDVDRVNL